MRFLVAEDDFGSRRLLQTILTQWGSCDVVVDGDEAVEAVALAWEEGEAYDMIFLDIMMPRMNGIDALKKIREYEKSIGIVSRHEVPVVMTTALSDPKNVIDAYHAGGATSYLVKPIKRESIEAEIRKFEGS